MLANPVQIHQVVMNLCTNAYHAIGASDGKTIANMAKVNLRPDDSQAEFDASPGAHVHLEVRDTGQGINRQTLNKMFDPYFSTKKRGEGTGLGLAVVHGIVKKHLGQITANSEPGRGTVFHVFLPCSASKCAIDALQSDAPIIGGTGHIVFDDDEQPIAAMNEEKAKAIGIREYLSKPVTERRMAESIRRLLDLV